METSFIDKLKKIKLSISEIMSGTDVQLDTADTLEDGTPVQFSPELEAGATVMITSEEGTQPLADGEDSLTTANKTVIIYEGISSTEQNLIWVILDSCGSCIAYSCNDSICVSA